MIKLVRITTVPISLEKLIAGQAKFMGQHGFEVSLISSPGKGTAELAQRENSVFIPLEMTRTISPIADLVAIYKLRKILKELKADIVHTHTPKAGFIGMIASKFAGVPIRLHTVAGLPLMEITGAKRKILEFVERFTYSCANKVYPNSKNLKEFIIESKFCSPQKLEVIGNGGSNGIDTEYFKINDKIEATAISLKDEHNIKPGDFVFVFVGRMVKDKGIEELVIAFDNLSAKHSNIKLVLVGPFESELDPLSENCRRIMQENKNIIHTGYQQDVRPYLAMSNALVFPSYREGFPNVPMQAGCFDLPSVVTNINGCNEIVQNEVNGLIIEPKNAVQLQDAMERIMQDKALYSRLKSNARKMITDNYEQTYFWSLLFNEYHKQLKEHEIIS